MFDKEAVLVRLEDYIDSHDDPTIPEFCSDKINPCRDSLYDWSKEDKRFFDAIKRLQNKQEAFLIKAKDINPVMAIFRLKQPQHGYTDKQEIKHDVNSTIVVKVLDDIDEE